MPIVYRQRKEIASACWHILDNTMRLPKDQVKNTIAERLRDLRVARGLTQEELAERVGVVKMTIAHFEQKKRLASVDVLMACAAVLRTSVDYLVGLTDSTDCDPIHQHAQMQTLLEILNLLRDDQLGIIKATAEAMRASSAKS